MDTEALEHIAAHAAWRPPMPHWHAPAAHPAEEDKASPAARLLALVMEEIDYGIAIVSLDGRLHHANALARRELEERRALELSGDRLFARRSCDRTALAQALQAAGRSRGSLLWLGVQCGQVSVAVVPIDEQDGVGSCRAAALLFQKRQAFEALTLSFFARSQRLTAAETTVLECLCSGLRPLEIARQLGVAISTVRTHVSNIRGKTQTGSTRELLQMLAKLPPLTPVVKTLMAQ